MTLGGGSLRSQAGRRQGAHLRGQGRRAWTSRGSCVSRRASPRDAPAGGARHEVRGSEGVRFGSDHNPTPTHIHMYPYCLVGAPARRTVSQSPSPSIAPSSSPTDLAHFICGAHAVSSRLHRVSWGVHRVLWVRGGSCVMGEVCIKCYG